MNPYLIAILAILTGSYLFDLIVERLNLSRLSPELPEEFRDHYDSDKYAGSQAYTRERTRFSLVQDTVGLAVVLAMILLGVFNIVDQIARSIGWSEIPTGLVFTGILMLGSAALNLPFSVYSTFVIEEKFGFNRTTAKTFILDRLKGLLLTAILGGGILALALWFFGAMGNAAWLCVWGALTVIQVVISFIVPTVILPLFNKFTPLAEGDLRRAVERFTGEQDFRLKGIFTIDGSRRSSKSNAFFTGFGKSKRIALYDTMVEKFSVPELVSVLAHEVGHYKHRHIMKSMAASFLSNGLMLFILSQFLNNRRLFDAFGMEDLSIYGSLVFFGFLYSPVSSLFSVAMSAVTRKFEFQADRYAVRTTEDMETFIGALKKLAVENLSNLTPHPLKVFLSYSHPPVLERIRAVRKT